MTVLGGTVELLDMILKDQWGLGRQREEEIEFQEEVTCGLKAQRLEYVRVVLVFPRLSQL